MNQQMRSLLSRGRATLTALADAIAWRARGRPRISEWVDRSSVPAEYSVRFSLHNPSSQGVTIDSAAIMMGDEALLHLSSYSTGRFDVRRLPLHLAGGSSEPFDFRPSEVANLVARHGGRGKVILHGVCQLQGGRHIKGRPMLFDMRAANSPPVKGSLAAQDPIARAWAWVSDRYPGIQTVRKIGLANDVEYLTHQEMLAMHENADTRDQPSSAYRGQPIRGFSMWKTGDVDSPGRWRAVMVLEDQSRIELVQDHT